MNSSLQFEVGLANSMASCLGHKASGVILDCWVLS